MFQLNRNRKIFIVVAGGNLAAERHFEDTIKRKRRLSEVQRYLPQEEIENLEVIYHNSPFIVWGAVPGPMNEIKWEKMKPGDVVLIYNQGYIRYTGEIAAKARSKDLARYFWKETSAGETWELMYFIVNEQKVNVPFNKLNKLFGYKETYSPQGFSMINEEAAENFLKNYGDPLNVLKTLDRGEELHEVPKEVALPDEEFIEEAIEKAPTEHDEMQWRLIKLGRQAQLDVWIPKNDQGKRYEEENFRDLVMTEFHETLDVPISIKNIDVVWKFGPYSLKSAFEIEHSTSVYSGILRLSDLRTQTPNSTYPLFIVASEDRRRKVFEELRRPTFSGPCLRLNEVVRFLDYEKIREISESFRNKPEFDANILLRAGEIVS